MKAKVRTVSPGEGVSYRLSALAKRLDLGLATVHIKKLGISVANWKILRVIGYFGPLSASELGARTHLDPDKITRAVDTLVARGYVIRRNDDEDRRRVTLTLSAKGRRAYEKIEAHAIKKETEFLRVLTLAEQKALRHFLAKLEQGSSEMTKRGGHPQARHLAAAAPRSPAVRPARRAAKGAARRAFPK